MNFSFLLFRTSKLFIVHYKVSTREIPAPIVCLRVLLVEGASAFKIRWNIQGLCILRRLSKKLSYNRATKETFVIPLRYGDSQITLRALLAFLSWLKCGSRRTEWPMASESRVA